MATRRFLSLEKRLSSTPEIYEQYKIFMKEYLSLHHMEEITDNNVDIEKEHYYIPHHYVLRKSSSTTKLRVVFDASAKTSSGTSLNDNLMVGPKVQDDLYFILLRFRCHNIAITADVQKMYRQVNVHSKDRDFQRIVWRDHVEEPLKTFRLCTVTYGTASTPYLATRALKQLAMDENIEFPKATQTVLQDFYVDDVLTGASSVKEATELVIQLHQLLKRGGFELHKWYSNEEAIFKGTDIINAIENSSLDATKNKATKVLGIEWHPNEDEFTCNFSLPSQRAIINKRTILSVISSIFDPLGWIAPFVIFAKMFMQELWKLDLSWDERIPENVQQKWMTICKELPMLRLIRIPRKVLLSDAIRIELHAFCDASEKGYGTVLYVRSVSIDQVIGVKLLTAKTRVAPLKSISIPRLELCAALLLAHLVQTVQSALHVKFHQVFAWTDSTIVLSWLNAEPSRWQTFVANRVSEIQTALPTAKWNHIKGKENPSDCISRGLLPSELGSYDLWWNGPPWLSSSEIPLANDVPLNNEALKEERKRVSCASLQTQPELSIISNISSFPKLQRIIAWCLRFTSNTRLPTSERNLTFLTSSEIRAATACIIRVVQTTSFSKEIRCLESGKTLPTRSNLISLCPFLDFHTVLRVGGRLKHAQLSEDEKYPILLPKKHHVTNIIVRHFHEKYLHAAPELLLSLIRQQYWIVAARSTIRKIVKNCVTCCRHRAQVAQQLMADLPQSRVTPSRSFQCIGLDFAGPFMVRQRSGRGQKTFKCYVCVFVCFVTKAIHLEVVEDLSTKACLSTLMRFIARRGKPTEIHSDCGTNFKGADREIRKWFLQCKQNEEIQGYLAEEEMKWIFNPPAAPHFGGLWESAVKSMKFHLRRTVGDTVLTYVEFSTLITQVEAGLNSRPLCPMSADPTDFTTLTPGHFLIGSALTTLPEPESSQSSASYLDRWHVRQAVLQQFWKRWSREYLAQLQQRPKWRKSQGDLTVNDLVLIKDENLPPLKWKLGRVISVHPGADNKVRVVTIRTSNGIFKRPIVKLCPLPVNSKGH